MFDPSSNLLETISGRSRWLHENELGALENKPQIDSFPGIEGRVIPNVDGQTQTVFLQPAVALCDHELEAHVYGTLYKRGPHDNKCPKICKFGSNELTRNVLQQDSPHQSVSRLVLARTLVTITHKEVPRDSMRGHIILAHRNISTTKEFPRDSMRGHITVAHRNITMTKEALRDSMRGLISLVHRSTHRL